ncbi:hypothetical protein [Halobacillus hunanensis]|uniref:hypothetical protein n=1 Tax=Halobacillus hunanensis TaxID=578214 RepID=UPI0009A5FCC9|nr:hypothetical protein [Halobacillus hunanensis]
MRKISAALLALTLTVTLFIPFSSAFASGGWDYVGHSTFREYTGVAESTGGDFMFVLNAGPSGWYHLWEDDPAVNDYVGKKYLSHGESAIFRNIGGFVDGSNDEAEFFVKKHHNQNTKSYMIFFD